MAVPASVTNCRFGAYEVDRAAGELRKGGVRIHIQEQPFRILTALLDRPGDVVTRDELRRLLWPDDTFVDFEHSLNAAVNKLREVLGDSATHPRFVETVPRRGYRFVYPLEGPDGPASGSGTDQAVDTARRRGWGRPRWVGALAATALVVIVVAWKMRGTIEPVPQRDSAPWTPVPLTSFPGLESSPTFSPDGSQIAFSWTRENQGNANIYLTVSGGAEPRALTAGPHNDYSPAWSPDGRSIAFLRQMGGGESEIRLVSPVGGSESRLGQLATGSLNWWWPVQGPVLAWSPDGKWLVAQNRESADEPVHLLLLSVESGERRHLTSSEARYGDWSPAFSPDGRTLAFVRAHDFGFRLLALTLDRDLQPQGAPRVLNDDGREMTTPVFSADGQRVIYSAGPPADYTLWGLWEVDVEGNAPARPLGLDGIQPAISRQGHRLAYHHVTQEWSIHQIERAGRSSYSEPLPAFRSTRLLLDPRFSRDGTKMVFASTRSGLAEIWVAERDGQGAHRLTSIQLPAAGSPSWSPDGTTIVFDAFDGSTADIFAVDSAGGPLRKLTTHPASDFRPSWSKDSRWVYFASTRSGEDQIWRVPFPDGKPEQVTHGGGWDPAVSPDGKYVYYLKHDGTIWRIPASGGEEHPVCDSCRVYTVAATLAAVEGGLYFLDLRAEPDGRSVIRYLDLATGSVEFVARIDNPRPSGLSASVDGRTILYSHLDRTSADIMLVENFR